MAWLLQSIQSLQTPRRTAVGEIIFVAAITLEVSGLDNGKGYILMIDEAMSGSDAPCGTENWSEFYQGPFASSYVHKFSGPSFNVYAPLIMQGMEQPESESGTGKGWAPAAVEIDGKRNYIRFPVRYKLFGSSTADPILAGKLKQSNYPAGFNPDSPIDPTPLADAFEYGKVKASTTNGGGVPRGLFNSVSAVAEGKLAMHIHLNCCCKDSAYGGDFYTDPDMEVTEDPTRADQANEVKGSKPMTKDSNYPKDRGYMPHGW